ncbi:MAG: hypothetical protein QOF55_14 [Thermoleophilaceae bacterium]|nr:hypothetical protein [Thermoleophilaceae bacterium]
MLSLACIRGVMRWLPLGAVAVALAAAAPTARADIIAASDSISTDGSLDIALVDINTDTHLTLPAGVNTSVDETRPSITPDGNRLVFVRGGGTTRIVMVDLPTGQSADLFNGFEVASHTPLAPSITADGSVVFTGGRWRQVSGGFQPYVTATDVTGFPTAPFPHTDLNLDRVQTSDGTVDDVTATGSSIGSQVAFRAQFLANPSGLALATRTSAGLSGVVRTGGAEFAHPVLGTPGGSPTLVFDEHGRSSDRGKDIVFVAADLGTFGPATPTPLPPVVNGPGDESRPAFTPDSRYLVFVRRTSDLHNRLFAWDTQTQTIVNTTGVNTGSDNGFNFGSPSLYLRPVFKLSDAVLRSGIVTFNVIQTTSVGILVQRVTGHHLLFGRRVPTLKPVGRVPLGHFKKGHGKTHWNLRVNGKPLPRGTYQVTPRTLAKNGKVTDLAKPVIIHLP